jgi:hypothetical protein
MSTPPTTKPIIMSADASKETTYEQKTVVVAMALKGSALDFSMQGQDACTWKMTEGKEGHIFPGITAANKMARVDTITLLQSNNSFNIALGVNMNCGEKKEVTAMGDAYSFTTMPNMAVSVPQVLMEADASNGDAKAWSENFPTFTSANLGTEGVLTLGNCPYVFVNQMHPVINLIRMNKGMLGVDIDTIPKMDNEWYKLSQPLMNSCCDAIKSNILSKMEQTDLFNFTLQAHPLSGGDWASNVDMHDMMQSFFPDPSWSKTDLQLHTAAHQKNFLERPGVLHLRMEVKYSIPVTKNKIAS